MTHHSLLTKLAVFVLLLLPALPAQKIHQPVAAGGLPVCSATVTSGCQTGPNGSGVTIVPGTLSVGNTLLVPVTISTSGPVTVSVWGFYLNNASGALTYNLPTPTSANLGTQFCFRNDTGKSGAITIATASSSIFIDVAGANGTVGTLVSSGSLGDSACVLSVSTTQFIAYTSSGIWTNN